MDADKFDYQVYKLSKSFFLLNLLARKIQKFY